MRSLNPPSRSYKPLMIWLEPADHLRLKPALKILAIRQNRTLKDIVVEALDDLLTKYAEEVVS
jgi:hypothetical protein